MKREKPRSLYGFAVAEPASYFAVFDENWGTWWCVRMTKCHSIQQHINQGVGWLPAAQGVGRAWRANACDSSTPQLFVTDGRHRASFLVESKTSF